MKLQIQNLILIEKAEIAFGNGLNILTGETGSGKSSILEAIRLIAGERADAGCIRVGADMAVVEAVLNDLCIRRELHRSGKNRCFINDSLVTLSELKQAVPIEVIDPHSPLRLLEGQKRLLDEFAELQDETNFPREKELEIQLASHPEKELEWAQKELALFEETQWDQEAKFAEEHHLLANAQHLGEKMASLNALFNDDSPIHALKRALPLLDACARVDTSLQSTAQIVRASLLELEEAARLIENKASQMEADPKRLAFIEEQIAAIEILKKRFGQDLPSAKERVVEEVDRLSLLVSNKEAFAKELATLRLENQKKASALTQARKEAAPRFAKAVLSELKGLNLPHAQFTVHVGDTLHDVRLLFSANPGVAPAPLQDCASGGELARLFLAIKLVLSDSPSMIVFDEIDSNVGGQTAALLGEKLRLLGQKRPVVCVTHFVQVAKCALDHFLVSKREKSGQSVTDIAKLGEKERLCEYNRMLGTVA